MSVVRWSAPAAPTVGHAGGDQSRNALVRGRLDTLLAAVVNASASAVV
jgi:hypothetical protein